MLARALLATVVLGAAMLGASGTSAQDHDEDPEALFREGVQLLGDQRYEPARVLLERALEVEPRASTAFNLASAYFALDRALDAHRTLARVESGEVGELPEGFDDAMATLRASIDSAVARLEVRAARPDRIDVFIDDEAAGAADAENPVSAVLAPGSHRVRAVADGFLEGARTVSLSPGQRESIQFTLRRGGGSTGPIDDRIEGEPESTPGGGFDWGLALGVTAIIVGVLGGIAIGVGFALSGEESRFVCDPAVGCIDT